MKKMSDVLRKKRVSLSLGFSAIIVFAILFQGCRKDYYKKFTHTWAIPTDEVTLYLKPDSSFILNQRNDPARMGTWRLEDNGNFIIFKSSEEKTSKRLKVKEITATKLVLSDNGLEQDYIMSDQP
jgi:hypothetical protein